MKTMKLMALGLVFFGMTASAQSVEHVYCESENGRYTVNFNLDHDVATQLVFKDGDQVIAQFDSVIAHMSRMFKVYSYEFGLGGAQYFDLERRKNSSYFTGAFFFGWNPLRFEVPVQCIAGVR